MKTANHLVCLLALIAFNLVHSQHFPSREYTIADGMPSNSVFDITQHPSGMMWFVTKSGPAYYNANEWHSFPDSLGLPSSTNARIRALGEHIWTAGLNDTAFVVQYYDQSEGWKMIPPPPPHLDFRGLIAFDVRGDSTSFEVFLATGTSLIRFHSLENRWTPVDLGVQYINNIHVLANRCFIVTSNGLFDYENNKLSKVPLPYQDLPSEYLLALDYKQDTFYVLGFNWFAEIRDDEIQYLLEDAGLNNSSRRAKSSIVAVDDLIIYGSNTTARMVDKANNTWQNLLIDGKDAYIGSTRIFADQENSIWVSDTRGLFKFNLLQFENWNNNSGLAENEVSALYEVSTEEIILANPRHLNILNGQLTSNSIENNSSQNFRILDIEEDTKNNQVLLAANDGGIIFYESGDFSKPVKSISGEHFRITSVARFQGQIYAGGTKGLYKVRNKELIPVAESRAIRNMSVLGDRLGIYTSGRGIYLYDGTEIREYSSPVFDLKSVYDGVIFKDRIVLATRDGIATLQNEEIVHLPDIPVTSPVYSLLVDQQNRLWIGTDHGVYTYDGISLKHYDKEDGLLGNEINRNALMEDSKGQIWIGTEKGVSLFKGRSQLNSQINLDVTIEDVIVNNQISLLNQKDQRLNYNENNLEISFYCLSFIDEEKINFRYRLRDNDQWVHLPNATSNILLTSLSSGNYQFDIQARYAEGDWGPETSFDFSIQNPFYYQWWFVLLIIVILIASARTVFYFRYILLIRKQKKLKELVADRTREIRDLNEQLEEKVRERTKELLDKNIRLEEYAHINAHYLRAPLSRIMSVIHLAEEKEENLQTEDMIRILKESVEELDSVIYSINDVLRE